MAATVVIKADVGGAVRAFRGLAGEAGRLSSGLRGMGRDAVATGLGMVGATSAVEGIRRAMQLGRAAVQAYTETNQEAAERFAAVRHEAQLLTAAFGEAMVGGDNLERSTGTMVHVLQTLREIVNDNADTIQNMVRGAMVAFIRSAEFAVTVGVRLAQTWQLVRMGIAALQAGVAVLTNGMDALGFSIASGVMQVLADLRLRLVDAARTMAELPLLTDGMREGLRSFAASQEQAAAATREQVEALRAQAEMSGDTALRAVADYNATVDDATSKMLEYEAVLGRVHGAADQLVSAVRDGTAGQHSYRRAVEGTNGALAEQANLGATAIDYLDRFIDRLSITRAKEEARAEALRQMQIAEKEANQAMLEDLREKGQARKEIYRQEIEARGQIASAVAGFAESMSQGENKFAKTMRVIQATALGTEAIINLFRSAMMIANPATTVQGVLLSIASATALSKAIQMGAQVGGGQKPGRGGGGGGGGGDRIFAPNVNVSVGGGSATDARAIAAAVTTGIKRGYLDMESGR